MSDYWGYVAAGYGITVTVLVAYGSWIWRRTRRARRALGDEASP
jgi:hypothetical protein